MPSGRVDMRSDCVTQPTDQMREAMRRAEVGAFLDHEDPTVARLERLGAERFGKEAALFLPSVTMANLIACLYYCRPGDRVLVDEDAHVYRNEVSGMTRLAGLMPHVVRRVGALPCLKEVAEALSYRSGGAPLITLLWLENTHNVGGGAVAHLPGVSALRQLTATSGVPIHVDGARIFNAVVASGTTPAELAADVDSISVGFTKGLSCPVGCLLVGSKALVEAGALLRRMLGGRLLKAGIVAAACIVAMDSMMDGLAEDHAQARRLASAIEAIPGLRLNASVTTNIVRFDTAQVGTSRQFADGLTMQGVLVNIVGPTTIRAVLHRHITAEALDRAIVAIRAVAGEIGTRETAVNEPRGRR